MQELVGTQISGQGDSFTWLFLISGWGKKCSILQVALQKLPKQAQKQGNPKTVFITLVTKQGYYHVRHGCEESCKDPEWKMGWRFVFISGRTP
jgi:hypothetical protein